MPTNPKIEELVFYSINTDKIVIIPSFATIFGLARDQFPPCKGRHWAVYLGVL